MEEYNLKTKVVGVDISNERTTYAIVDVRGNILAEDSFPTTDYPDVNNFVTALPSAPLVSAARVPALSPVVSRMPPTCLGRGSCLCQRCYVTAWDWLWVSPTMRISLLWVNSPSVVRTV